MVSNSQIASVLEELARLLELTGADGFRVNAHNRAARAVEASAQEIASLASNRAALVALEGVGPKLADKIAEIASTGQLAEAEELRSKVPAGLFDLMRVPGLGPKTVRAMWQANITDIPSLKLAVQDGSLLKLPRMGDKAVTKIKDSLIFFDASATRTHLGRAWAVAGEFISAIEHIPGVLRVQPAGSMRRGKETVGDIDILVGIAQVDGEKLNADLAHHISEAFCSHPGVVHVLARGEGRSSVLFRLDSGLGRWKPNVTEQSANVTPNITPLSAPAAFANLAHTGPTIQVDLRVLPISRFGSALMYFTGSKEHNVKLRERSLAMGYTLNEWGLFPASERTLRANPNKTKADATQEVLLRQPPQDRGVTPIAGATEEEVFAKLGLPWIPPEVREDRGEFSPQDPWNLVQLADITADLHAHTTASDGLMSILELASEAMRRGFHSIAVTDHSQSSTIAGGLKPDRLLAHIAAIRQAQTHLPGIRILAGSEVDILADGSLDYDDELLAKLDVVVASPHAALTQDSVAATARLIAAISHPSVHIIGHPTGRLLLRRAGLSPDMPAVIRAAAAHDVALEINSHWMRLDLRDTHARAAIEAGVPLAISCDTHELADFDNLRFGIATARRAWATAGDVINTWAAPRLHTWLRKGRR